MLNIHQIAVVDYIKENLKIQLSINSVTEKITASLLFEGKIISEDDVQL